MTEDEVRQYLEEVPKAKRPRRDTDVDGHDHGDDVDEGGGADHDDSIDPVAAGPDLAFDAEAAIAELAALRDVWEQDRPTQLYFCVKILGGAATKKKKWPSR